jgi:hypothetical protein
MMMALLIGISLLCGETEIEVGNPGEETGTLLFDSLNVSFVGNWPFGPCYAVACDSVRDLVFCGSGGGVYVLDVSTPSTPVKLSDAIRTKDWIKDLFYDHTSQRLYIAAETAGLEIWDVGNPLLPEYLGHHNVNWDDVVAVFVSGYYAYVAGYWSGLWIIDISTPSNPQTIGHYDTPARPEDVYVAGEFAFVVDYNHVRVIDVSVPLNPQQIGLCAGGGYSIYFAGGYVFVAGGSQLRIVDISNPANPYVLGSCAVPHQANGIWATGSYAYITESGVYGNGSLRVIDISEVSQPIEVGHINTHDSTSGVCVLDSFAYIVGRGGLKSIDVSTPSNPQEVGSFATTQSALRVFVSDSFAYITGSSFSIPVQEAFSGFRIIDISTPSNPEEIGYFSSSFGVADIFATDKFVYLANDSVGLRIIDVSDPLNPQEVGYYDTAGNAYGVFVRDTLAFVADWDSFRVIDVATPSNPQEVGKCKPQSGAYRVFVSGSYAYIVYYAGLSVVDISIPSNPQEVGYCVLNYPGDVHVSGSYAYVTNYNYNGGLYVVDVSIPTNPQEIAFCQIDCNNWDVYVVGSFAYVANDWSGLIVIDISAPSSPQIIGYYYPASGNAWGVFSSGSYVYIAASRSGLQVYRNLLADNIEESKDAVVAHSGINFLQNPVKGDFIEILLTSPAQGKAEIILYNQIGQRLRTYQFSQLKPGESRVKLDVKGLPCGIYFLKLNGASVGKVIKVK